MDKIQVDGLKNGSIVNSPTTATPLNASLPRSAQFLFRQRRGTVVNEVSPPSVLHDKRHPDSFSMEHSAESHVNSDTKIVIESDSGQSSDESEAPSSPSPPPAPSRLIKLSIGGKKKDSTTSQTEQRHNFWEQIARTNRVEDVRRGRRDSDERQLQSANHIRQMRKKVSVTSRGKKKTNQEDLAMAIVDGNVGKVEDIIEAYVTLYRGDGFRMITRFRYDIDPRTMIITCVENPLAADQTEGVVSPEGVSKDMFLGLSALHIACAFDQENVVNYFLRYGNTILRTTTPSGQSLLHTCSWFGCAAPMAVLLANGADVHAANSSGHRPLHLSALRGRVTCTKMLIRNGADLEAPDERGNTPLHAAVLAGNFECSQELIFYGVDTNKSNDDNGSPLHYASSLPLVALLIQSGADPTIEIKEAGDEKQSKTAFSLFLERMPEGCDEILNSYVSFNGKSFGAVDLEISYDFEMFLREYNRNPRDGETGTLATIVEFERRELLKHPVSESFLHMKWLLVKHYFAFYLMFYTLFLISITSLVLLNYSRTTDEAGFDEDFVMDLSLGFEIATTACLAVLAFKNLFLMTYDFSRFISTWQNYVELLLVALCGAFVATFYAFNSNAHLAALSVFVAWFNFTLLLGKLPSGGIYINMIVGVSKDFVKFFTLYASTLVAFGLAFHVVLGGSTEHFRDPVSAILCSLGMMVGEIGFGDLFTSEHIKYHGTKQVLFVLFLLFVTIIIMNLLVGLAISNITQQFKTAGVYRLRMTVLLIRVIEDILRVFRKICPCCLRESQLFPFLRSKQGDIDNMKASCKVYVYPNQFKNAIFVLDASGKRRKTGFDMPEWIMNNTFNILKKSVNSDSLNEASEKRRLEDKLNKLSAELRLVRKSVEGMKLDMQLATRKDRSRVL